MGERRVHRWIRKHRRKGFSDHELHAALVSAGWDSDRAKSFFDTPKKDFSRLTYFLVVLGFVLLILTLLLGAQDNDNKPSFEEVNTKAGSVQIISSTSVKTMDGERVSVQVSDDKRVNGQLGPWYKFSPSGADLVNPMQIKICYEDKSDAVILTKEGDDIMLLDDNPQKADDYCYLTSFIKTPYLIALSSNSG